MVPGVAGSNPVIRPRNKKSPNGRFFISVQGHGFEPAKKPFEPPQKGGRKYAGCAHAQFCKVMKHSEIIRLSAPEIKNRPTGVFLFLCGVRSTLKTLAYDCGNPVQYVCGRNARTSLSFPRPGPGHVPPLQWRGTKYVPSRGKVPLCGGVPQRGGVVIVPHPPSCSARHPPPGGRWAFGFNSLYFIPILVFVIRLIFCTHRWPYPLTVQFGRD